MTLDVALRAHAGMSVSASKIEQIYVARIWGTRTLSPLFPDPPAGGVGKTEMWYVVAARTATVFP